MADDRWTVETEELVARALPGIASWCPDPQCGDSSWDHECQLGGERPDTASARKALTALADAGVLMPVGGETRQEWRVEVPAHPLAGREVYRDRALAEAYQRAIVKPTKLHTRTVHTEPWREVTE